MGFIHIQTEFDRLGEAMVNLLASSAEDRGVIPKRFKPKTINLLFPASPLSNNH